ncbi:helix-turn-helix domain-containing protein [Polycyclovorans algicola]|uniref:helix-turn-helix domain-containing protein n=1 Tax=Polycyclovorans algicola TaxID=616992 RepID=UPI0004A75F0A|nr:XRE family transcriptional regulator [Polycyclovorans algicola]
MFSSAVISNERQARDVASSIEQISSALSSEQVLKAIVGGLPREVIEGVRRSLIYERRELVATLESYQAAKSGDCAPMKQRAGDDPGALLIVARIVRGWSQKELARKLGLKEQAIQRYEAERYRSISLSNLLRVARALSVDLSAEISSPREAYWVPPMPSSAEVQKALKHARDNEWIQSSEVAVDDGGLSQLTRYIAEHVEVHGTPSLLRTGLNVVDHSGDWMLLSWKAQVTQRAKAVISKHKVKYRTLDVSWLMDLVRLSSVEDGPIQAVRLLLQHGIILVVERQIPGMAVDGAAFLVDDVPVIGMTLRRDSLDNFWFTLMHEVAHVILHYRTGLSAGFFDDAEAAHVDEIEAEANAFAGSLLIPEEIWSRSPARITKSAEPVERLATQLGISPAIIFGRIRMERKNFAIFSNKIGREKVRKQFLSSSNNGLPS